MKNRFLLGVLTVTGLSLVLYPLSVNADKSATEDFVVVNSKSATMNGDIQRASINCYANLSKFGLTFVATSTTDRAMDSIWTKCNSYTSGRQLINSNHNTVYGSSYGSAQASVGAIHVNARSLGYHTYKKSGYQTVELITSYNW